MQTMSSTFNVKIDDALTPIKLAVKELQMQTSQQQSEMRKIIEQKRTVSVA